MAPDLTPIAHACAIAWAHINAKTLTDASPTEIRACMQSAGVRRTEQRLQEVALMGDVVAVRAILNDINKAYKAALVQVRQRKAA